LYPKNFSGVLAAIELLVGTTSLGRVFLLDGPNFWYGHREAPIAIPAVGAP
jgi:hypothetical protein